MKKRNNLIVLILLGILIILLGINFVFSQSANDFNPKDSKTWTMQNIEELAKTESGRQTLNSLWENSNSGDRAKLNLVAQHIAIDLSKKRIAASSPGLLSGITNLLSGKKSETKQELVQLEKLTGFGSSKLKWIDKYTITDGNVKLNLDKVPNSVKEIEYDEKNERFVLKLKTGGEIVVESGEIKEDKIIDKNNREIKISLDSLKQITDRISFFKDGKIQLEGKTEISINDRIFALNDKVPELFIPYIRSFSEKNSLWQKAIIEIVDNEHFKVSGYVKVTSENAIIRTFGEKPTDIIFKQGDFSQFSKYIQFDGNKIDIGNKNGNRFSDFIDIELSKPYKDNAGKEINYEIKGNGKGIFIENGKRLYEIDGSETKTLRKVEEGGFKLNLLNGQSGNVFEDVGEEDGTAKIGNKDGGEKRVCIGGSCSSVSKWEAWKLVVPSTEFIVLEGNYEQPKGGVIVSKGLLYISEQEANDFLKSLPSGLSSEEFSNMLSKSNIVNIESRIELFSTVSKGQIDSKISEMLESASFSENQMTKITTFKEQILARKEKIPKGTSIVLSTDSKQGSIKGIFTITSPGENQQTFVIDEGDKIKTMILQNIGER